MALFAVLGKVSIEPFKSLNMIVGSYRDSNLGLRASGVSNLVLQGFKLSIGGAFLPRSRVSSV